MIPWRTIFRSVFSTSGNKKENDHQLKESSSALNIELAELAWRLKRDGNLDTTKSLHKCTQDNGLKLSWIV
jgi:hypothetical protein